MGQIHGSLEAGGLDPDLEQKVRDRAQRLLFKRHEKHFPDVPVRLLYGPKDTQRQNIMVTIPGPLELDGRPDEQERVLNDVVEMRDGKWGQDWALGYAITVHSSQGLTSPRVEYMHQLERVVCSPEDGSEGVCTLTEQQLGKAIAKILVAHKRQDQAKGLRFLKVGQILELKEVQNNHCAACNIELLWAYQPKDTQQFSIDRLDNSVGHVHNNIRLTCLECNQKRIPSGGS
ncbi:MAG: hypothetical protein AB2556_21150 [Candidatus Thiodiazotropha sp.]